MAPKSCQIAHIYCLFFLMVVVCLAGWCMGMQTMPASAIVILTCSLIALSVFQKRNIAE